MSDSGQDVALSDAERFMGVRFTSTDDGMWEARELDEHDYARDECHRALKALSFESLRFQEETALAMSDLVDAGDAVDTAISGLEGTIDSWPDDDEAGELTRIASDIVFELTSLAWELRRISDRAGELAGIAKELSEHPAEVLRDDDDDDDME